MLDVVLLHEPFLTGFLFFGVLPADFIFILGLESKHARRHRMKLVLRVEETFVSGTQVHRATSTSAFELPDKQQQSSAIHA